LLFKSPTCTKEDEAIARMLAEIADVDIEKYGLDMLKAGTDLSDKTVEELLSMDAKEFTMGDAKVEKAQVNEVDNAEINQKKNEKIIKMLAEIVDVDIEKYGLEILKAGTDLSDKTVEELLSMDAKEFTMGDAKVEIAQVNAVDIAEIYQEQDEIEAAIQKVI